MHRRLAGWMLAVIATMQATLALSLDPPTVSRIGILAAAAVSLIISFKILVVTPAQLQEGNKQ